MKDTEFKTRTPHAIYLAIMDRLGVRLVLLDDLEIDYEAKPGDTGSI